MIDAWLMMDDKGMPWWMQIKVMTVKCWINQHIAIYHQSWCLNLDVWILMYESWCMNHDAWCMRHVLGTWCIVHEVLYIMYDTYWMMLETYIKNLVLSFMFNEWYIKINIECFMYHIVEFLAKIKLLKENENVKILTSVSSLERKKTK